MEKRLLLAVLLMSAVILVTEWIFPPTPPAKKGVQGDSAAVVSAPIPAVRPAPVVTTAPAVAVDSVVVASPLYRYVFSTRGAALERAELLKFPSYTERGKPVQLVPPGTEDFLAHRLVVGRDTIDLRAAGFQPSTTALTLNAASGEQAVRFTYGAPGGVGVELTYTFRPDAYVVAVQGRVTGATGPATLLTELGPGLAQHEAFDHHSERELAVVSRANDKVDRELLSRVKTDMPVAGPLTWAGIRDKYFLAALVAAPGRTLSSALVLPRPAARQLFIEKGDTQVVQIPRAQITTAQPVAPDGSFAYRAYLGPQERQQLAAVGYELQDATPVAYFWLEPIIRPFAALILVVLNFMHQSLGLAYGWVLILFGVMMRVILWPLNAKAMRAQMKNAAVAPRMQEIREKYASDPQKQQQELMKLYKEEGFNPMAGCLPMLIPFPVLITLFFVFRNTIGFRGAQFLWLPDLSLRDPLRIIPLLLVISMFALQVISTRMSGIEQNPQTKMTMYMMPLIMGLVFFNLPSGLNLYYLASNVASIPQQILIARERRQTQGPQKRSASPSAAPPPSARERKRKTKG